MSMFSCDYINKKEKQCNRKPFMEMYPVDEEKSKESGYPAFKSWLYLCRWHYYLHKILRTPAGYCKVSTDREILEEIMDEIYDIEDDLLAIKEKLKIKSNYPSAIEKLWNNPEDDIWNDIDERNKSNKK